MDLTRRAFIASSLAGTAGLCVGGLEIRGFAADAAALPPDEDGYKLWLRYAPPGEAARSYRKVVRQIRVDGTSTTSGIIRDELRSATSAMLGSAVPLNSEDLSDDNLIVGTQANSALIRDLNWSADLSAVGDQGYIIRSARIGNGSVTVIAANTELGALYGSFHFLRLMQTGQRIDKLETAERPALQRRLMNHWDNPNGTIERGYAGRSMWQWNELPEKLSPRYANHARACSSIGINGAVINNVNADPSGSMDRGLRRRICGIAGARR